MAVKLTQGAVSIICHDKYSPDDEFMPMLQVINVDKLPYRRIILSDGWDYIVGIFLLNLDELDYSSRLHKGSIIKLTHFVVNKFLKNRNYKTIVINDLEVIVDKCELVVDPVSLHNNVPYFLLAAGVVHSNSYDFNQFSRVSSPTGRKAKMDVNLTQWAIVRICGDNFCRDDKFNPVLQVTDCQNHVLGLNHDLSLSDGSHFATAILFTQLQELVHSRRLQQGSVVKLTHFFVDKLQNRKVMIIVDLDVILEECELIGEPVPLSIYAP